MDNKKAWGLMNWFVALMLIMFVSVAYFAITKPFQYVDHYATPRINLTTATGQDADEVVNKVRMYWRVWPIIIIASLILWAFFTSLKQDPNYPQIRM